MPDSQKDLHKKLLGKKGEALAAKYLKKLGYKLLAKNYRTPFGEADLIFSYGEQTVFVEVKTRTNTAFGEAKEAVDKFKQARYRKIALYFGKGAEPNARFDVVEVYPDTINHIPNAF